MSNMPLSFWTWGAEEPDRLAVVDPDYHEVSFGELLAGCNQVAHGLRSLGLQRGDCVAVVLPNHHTLLEVELAALQIGLYFTPINWHLTGPEIAYVLEDCEAQALVIHESFAEAGRHAANAAAFPEQARFAVGSVEGFRSYGELKGGQPSSRPEDRSPGQQMFYTSGTTGNPKGVRRPLGEGDPDEAASRGSGFPRMFDVEPGGDGRHIVPGPMYHTAVLVFCTNALHFGHAAVLMDRFTAEGCLERIHRCRVTWSHMVPTHFIRMLNLPDQVKSRYDVSCLRSIIHAAAPCPIEVKQKMLDWWGPVIYEYYAATEGGGTLVRPGEWPERPGTVGRPWPSAEIRIVDDDGRECPPGVPGTVYMKLPAVKFEYYKDSEKTKQSRLGDFFTVGDVGYLDEEGWLFLCDRKVDMIISGGVNIYPAEVENALITHPKVADVAVFGIPDPEWGEQVKAVVEPVSGTEGTKELTQELIDFCASRLAKYKCPRSIDFRQELPREENGKLVKRKIRDEYWADQAQRI